jgi:ATP-dependent helicase/nuclease subunit A
MMLVHQDRALWKTASVEAPTLLTEAQDAQKAAQEAERDRLLYVAMTRAETWLIVAAAKDPGENADSWYQKIEAGMGAVGARPHRFAVGDGQRVERGNWGVLGSIPDIHAATLTTPLPAFYTLPAPPVIDVAKTLSPSDLGGAKALPSELGQDEETAKKRGTHLHLLLEVLPERDPVHWPDLAMQMLTSGADPALADDIPALLTEVQNVLSTPALSPLFAPSTLAEVPVTADLPGLGRMHGVIDRLIITDSTVRIVDFKTNVAVPPAPDTCPEGVLRQMGAYAVALSQIYPNHQIETAILWTRTATLMELPAHLVADALSRTCAP